MIIARASNLLGKIAAPWARLLAELFIILLVVAGIFYWGYHVGDSRANDACAAAKTEDASARLASLTTLLKLGPDPTNQSGLLADKQARTTIVYRTIRERVPYVVNRYVSEPNPAPGYVYCPISRGIVSVWNDALAGQPSASAAAGESDGASTSAGAAQDEDSGLTIGDLVENHSDNSEQCTNIRDQLNALITWQENQRESKK